MLKVITRNHGENMECPACDEPGTYLNPQGRIGEFENPIWERPSTLGKTGHFANPGKEWVCSHCWLK